MSDSYPRRRTDVTVQVLDEEMVVLDQRLLQIHRLNAVATHVWMACDGRQGLESIADSIRRDFEVDRDTALRDVSAALVLLTRAGLLDGEPIRAMSHTTKGS